MYNGHWSVYSDSLESFIQVIFYAIYSNNRAKIRFNFAKLPTSRMSRLIITLRSNAIFCNSAIAHELKSMVHTDLNYQ